MTCLHLGVLVGCVATIAGCGFAQDSNRAMEGVASSAAAPDASPGQSGMHPGPLADLIAHVREREIDVHNVTVLRKGEMVLDVDFYPYSGDVPHDVASVTKSITSTLIGIAVDEGLIESVDIPVLRFLADAAPAQPSARLRRLTVRHLLTMTSGFCLDFGGGEAQLDAMRRSEDAVRFMLSQPLLDEPGERFAYCSGASQLLSAIVSRAAGMNAQEYAEARLFGPLGIKAVIWPTDQQGNSNGWGDFFIRPSDLARIGQLHLQKGVWEEKRILSEAWIAEATAEHVRVSEDEGYGFRWWRPGALPGLYEARGRGGQRLVVWPARDLVVVMIGSGFDPAEIGGFIVEALADAPLPSDPAVKARLREEIARAGAPPPPGPVAPLPPTAAAVSGRRYATAPNDLGLTGFRLDFPGDDEATITLTLDIPRSQEFGDRTSAVGLDGRYRITPSSRFGLPIAARGHWEDERTFRLTYNEVANNHIYDLVFIFAGDRASLSLSERTGLFALTLEATRNAL